jgi:thiol-disulfide isomerase/thioredoxin
MNYFTQIPSMFNFQSGGALGEKLSTNSIMMIMAAILFIIIGFSYYYFYLKPVMQATYRANDGVNEGNSNDKESSAYAELLLFYADWCPHCKTTKPIFDELSQKYKDKPINGYVVQFTKINCTNESPESTKLMDKYNVEGFPTIKLLMNGQIIEFDAKPTKDNLTQFFNTVLK